MGLNLTSLEKKAVSKVLLDIVNADGKVTFGEARYFDQLDIPVKLTPCSGDIDPLPGHNSKNTDE
jgi:hypothetical protein